MTNSNVISGASKQTKTLRATRCKNEVCIQILIYRGALMNKKNNMYNI